jgi:DNA polymerase III gamma/tau subunit
MVDFSTEQLERISAWAKEIPQERIVSAIDILSEAQAQVRLTSQKKVLVEMTLIKLCTPAMSLGEGDTAQRIRALETALIAQAESMKRNSRENNRMKRRFFIAQHSFPVMKRPGNGRGRSNRFNYYSTVTGKKQ